MVVRALALEVERAAVDGGQFPAGEAESSDPLRLLGGAQRTEVVDFIFPGGRGSLQASVMGYKKPR